MTEADDHLLLMNLTSGRDGGEHHAPIPLPSNKNTTGERKAMKARNIIVGTVMSAVALGAFATPAFAEHADAQNQSWEQQFEQHKVTMESANHADHKKTAPQNTDAAKKTEPKTEGTKNGNGNGNGNGNHNGNGNGNVHGNGNKYQNVNGNGNQLYMDSFNNTYYNNHTSQYCTTAGCAGKPANPGQGNSASPSTPASSAGKGAISYAGKGGASKVSQVSVKPVGSAHTGGGFLATR